MSESLFYSNILRPVAVPPQARRVTVREEKIASAAAFPLVFTTKTLLYHLNTLSGNVELDVRSARNPRRYHDSSHMLPEHCPWPCAPWSLQFACRLTARPYTAIAHHITTPIDVDCLRDSGRNTLDLGYEDEHGDESTDYALKIWPHSSP